MRVVLDTNVVVSAFLWNGAPAQLLHVCRTTSVSLFTIKPLLAELVTTLSRHKFEKHIAASSKPIESLMDLYASGVWLVDPNNVRGVAPDPADDVVLGTALAANANFIVTGDRAFLSVKQYRGTRIVSVRDALSAIEAI